MEDASKHEIARNVLKVTSLVDMVRAALGLPPETVNANKCFSTCGCTSTMSGGEAQDDGATAETAHDAAVKNFDNADAVAGSSSSSFQAASDSANSDSAKPEHEAETCEKLFGPQNSKRSEQENAKGFKRRRGGQNAEYFTYWSKRRGWVQKQLWHEFATHFI